VTKKFGNKGPGKREKGNRKEIKTKNPHLNPPPPPPPYLLPKNQRKLQVFVVVETLY